MFVSLLRWCRRCLQGMVKYASALPRESIVDVEGNLVKPEAAIEGCSQSQVRGRGEGRGWSQWYGRTVCCGSEA